MTGRTDSEMQMTVHVSLIGTVHNKQCKKNSMQIKVRIQAQVGRLASSSKQAKSGKQ